MLRPRCARDLRYLLSLSRWLAGSSNCGVITFLIGGIIAQQGIFHFRKFGADAYVVDMVGILVLREIGVLIVSMTHGRRSIG